MTRSKMHQRIHRRSLLLLRSLPLLLSLFLERQGDENQISYISKPILSSGASNEREKRRGGDLDARSRDRKTHREE